MLNFHKIYVRTQIVDCKHNFIVAVVVDYAYSHRTFCLANSTWMKAKVLCNFQSHVSRNVIFALYPYYEVASSFLLKIMLARKILLLSQVCHSAFTLSTPSPSFISEFIAWLLLQTAIYNSKRNEVWYSNGLSTLRSLFHAYIHISLEKKHNHFHCVW